MILFLKIYQISLMKKLWQSLVYFISQIITFLMLLRIESCFQSPTNMDIQLVFSGRKWQENDDSKAKYINTSATTIFDKSYELWNLDKAKPTISKQHEVYLMEGFMDVIAAYKAGINNVVASNGDGFNRKTHPSFETNGKKIRISL